MEVVDCFEQLWETPEETTPKVFEKPPLGRHIFEVTWSSYYEDSNKWSLTLLAVNGKGAIRKSLHLGEAKNRGKVAAWCKALHATPTGKFASHDWEQYIGMRLSAEVAEFTPTDAEEPIRYVGMPEPLENGEVETAAKSKPKQTRTAKIDRETKADKMDVPF